MGTRSPRLLVIGLLVFTALTGTARASCDVIPSAINDFPSGLGSTDTAIFQIDADGVALTSIQALGRRLRQAEAENAALRESLASLQARLDALEAAGTPR